MARIIWARDNDECDDNDGDDFDDDECDDDDGDDFDDDDNEDNDDNVAGADYMSWQARGATKVSIFGTICSPLSFLLVSALLALLCLILYIHMCFCCYTLSIVIMMYLLVYKEYL